MTVMSLGTILVAAAIVSVAPAFGQVTSDLTDPRLSTHASIPRYNPPGTPLPQMLMNARSLASSRGVAEWKGLDIVIRDHELVPPDKPLESVLLLAYHRQACAADAIIVGHISTSPVYRLSAAGTAVYGDYGVIIDSILKDNQVASIRSKADIVVTRPGGSIVLPEGPVKYDMQSFPPLTSGTTYLLFLRYIPQSGAYQALDELSTLVGKDTGWLIARKVFDQIVVPGFTRGGLEAAIAKWIGACR
jgi:hypothetical protein